MEDTVTLKVKLCGGEAFYITPVSHSYRDEDRKFHIYYTLEFLPRIPSPLRWITYQGRLHDVRLWCFRLTKLTRAAKVIAEVVLDNLRWFTGANVFDSWFPNRTWEWWDNYLVSKELNHKWFYAADVFPCTLHLEGNIEVDWSNVDKHISWGDDSYIGYLPPSSHYIEERLRERFHVWTFDKEEDKIAEEKFWKWRQEQIDKGYEVYYITSLET
jgi:hypothetical protein